MDMVTNTLDGLAPRPDRQIRLEQARLLYSHLPTSVSGTMFGVMLLLLMLWPQAPHGQLLAWAAAMGLNQGWRLALYLIVRKRGLDLDGVDRWIRLWAIGGAISGVLWAYVNIAFFVTASPLHQAMLFTLTFTIVAVAVPVVGSHLPSLYLFVVPVLLALVLRNAWQGDGLHLIIASATMAAMLGLLTVGRRYNGLLTASLRARFENEAFAARLAQQNGELEQERARAEAANIAKTKFLAAASHDLRQPLHALMLFTGSLSNERDPAQVARLAEHIGISAAALELLFNSLLDISKLDAGVVLCHETNFRLQGVFDRLANDFEPLAAQKRLRLTVRPTAAVVRTDPTLLEQMLRNLMTNALRYTESGGILLACRRGSGCWRIEVRDSGIGIPPEQHRRVFDEFYQIGNPERDRKRGLGLGLSIVAHLSALLGCPIALASDVGRGTTMAVSVPVGTAAVDLPRTESQVDVSSYDGLRVLVIDDEGEVRIAMETILRKWGCDPLSAESLVAAVGKMGERQWEPELAISDYRLRGEENGLDVLAWLREQYGEGLPCLLVTGDIEAKRLEAVRESGFPVLHKPIAPAKLRALIGGLAPRGGGPP